MQETGHPGNGGLAYLKSKEYPEGMKYRAWFSENGEVVFGFDNHKPKGPHLHIRKTEVGYLFRCIDELMN